MNNYTSILGYQCETRSNQCLIYPTRILDIFQDPISFEIIKEPIFLNEHPVGIYNKESLVNWFYNSNTEPLTGLKLDKFIKISPFINFYMALLLLEKKEDCVIFHQPKMDLMNFYELVCHLVESRNQKKEWTSWGGLKVSKINLDSKIVQLDIEDYLCQVDKDNIPNNLHNTTVYKYTNFNGVATDDNKKHYNCKGTGKKKHKYFKEYYNFSLEDVLINDLFTGKRLKDPVINSKNTLVETYKYEGSYTIGSIDGLRYGGKKCNGNIILNKIRDGFKDAGIGNLYYKKKKPEDYKDHRVHDALESIFDNEYFRQAWRKGDFYLSTNTTYEYMFSEYQKLIANKDKYPNFENNRIFLSKMIKAEPNILIKAEYGYDPIMENIREQLHFPVISNNGPYSDDYSFLKLDHTVFKTTDPNNHIKGRDFVGTDFSGTRFEGLHFMVCSFIANDLINAKFINCQFNETVFYKVSGIHRVEFVNCKFDKLTMDMVNKELGMTYK